MAKRKENRQQNRRRKKITGVKYRVRKKIGVVFLLVGGIFLVLAARIFKINYENGDKYSKIVLDHQQYTSSVLPYKRGQIVDRNGTQLAYSEKVYNLILDPKLMLSDEKYKEPTLAALSECFGINRQDVETILKNKPKSQYEKMLKNLTSDQVKRFNEMLADTKNYPNIKGVWLEDSYIRKYPFSTLACDVIGFSSQENGGEIGLEKVYDEELSGIDGVTYGYIDESLNIEQTTKEPVDGSNLITSLDFGVQSIIEKHIKAFNEEYGSKNTAVLVMNPNNGEIIGMASYPVFDLNNPRDLTGLYTEEERAAMTDEDTLNAMYDLWKNFCVSETFEPGSTFKPFTVATALEEGIVSDGDTFYCQGYEEVGGWTIKCHEKGGHGTLTLEQSVMYSCNPAMMQISAKLGNVKFSEYQKRFGLGEKSGIDLPGESTGMLVSGENMSVADLATMSFGQTFTSNMVQMASAFSSLINGGNYYRPHVVKRIESASGEIIKKYDAELVRQTVTSATSELLRTYLKATVDTGLAKNAKVAGYSMAGKTGTAQKLPRADNKYVISFLGYAPAEDPKFVVYVIIDEPEVEGYNGSSQPVLWLTKDIMTDLLPYMNVFKDTDLANEESKLDNSNNPVEKYDEAPLPSDMDGTANPTQAATQGSSTQKPTQAATQGSSTQKPTQAATQGGNAQKPTQAATQSGNTQNQTQAATKKQN
ncbi:MAG: penicillin-binding transpeptidase domain-containing protein [Bacteroides sp.]